MNENFVNNLYQKLFQQKNYFSKTLHNVKIDLIKCVATEETYENNRSKLKRSRKRQSLKILMPNIKFKTNAKKKKERRKEKKNARGNKNKILMGISE